MILWKHLKMWFQKLVPFYFLQVKDVYSISMVPEEGENASSASPVAFLSVVEVPNQAKSGMCLDAHINCQNNIDFQMKSKDTFTQCIVDIPNANGNSVSPESYEEGVESFKTGNSPTVSLINSPSSLLFFEISCAR
jgi:hypothetical protein